MQTKSRPAPFVLISTNHGTMIINRNDYFMVDQHRAFGVGGQLMNFSCFDQQEIDFALALLESRCSDFGEGVIAIDCGANIGVHTVEWAKLLHDFGHIFSFEAQEKIYYALAGNIALNNCLNVTARLAAVGAENGFISIPELDYTIPSSYGSFELKAIPNHEYIGQSVDYDNPCIRVPILTLDSLDLQRVDFIKIDVEGMELDVLLGAEQIIRRSKPQMIIETKKTNKNKIVSWLEEMDYRIYPMGLNILAIHATDPSSSRMALTEDGSLCFTQKE